MLIHGTRRLAPQQALWELRATRNEWNVRRHGKEKDEKHLSFFHVPAFRWTPIQARKIGETTGYEEDSTQFGNPIHVG